VRRGPLLSGAEAGKQPGFTRSTKPLPPKTPHTHFCGTIGYLTYRYYNLDQVVGLALTLSAELSELKKGVQDDNGPTLSRASRAHHDHKHSKLAAIAN
jgi:hypothetical protein